LLGNNLFFAPLNYPSVISLGLEDLKVNYVYELEDIYDISWGFEKFKNSIFMSITDIHGNNGKQYIISILNNEIIMNEQEVFKLDEDVDLCRYGFEYSEFALKRFIRNVVES
jgi:hypothetical protein